MRFAPFFSLPSGRRFGRFAGRAQNLSALAELPDYRRLDAYQETITREEFADALRRNGSTPRTAAGKPFIRLDPDAAVIRKTSVPLDDLWTLRFAPNEAARKPLPPAYWRPRAALPTGGTPAGRGQNRARPRPPRRTLGQVGGTLVPDRRRSRRSWKAR